MKYILDTNVISELRKGSRADPNLLAWFATVPEQDLRLSVLVTAEIARGIEALRPRDPVGAVALNRWLARLFESFEGRIIPIDVVIADIWARLSVPDPLPTVDGLLAATAIIQGATLVTRNTRDYARTGCMVLNPFVSEKGEP